MKLDTLVGLGMLLVATAVFVYYTFWTFAVPFIDDSSSLLAAFPPREWIIRIPAILLLAGTAVIGTFIGSVFLKQEQKRKLKSAQKKAQ